MKNQALELHSPFPKSFKVCKKRSKEKQRGKASKVKRSKEDSSCSLLSHFWSTSRSPFSTCYIPFQSSGSQESNTSNRVRFGDEMRKIWRSEANCSKLVRNSHNTFKIRTAHASCEFSSVSPRTHHRLPRYF